MKAAEGSCAKGETILNESIEINPQRVYAALKAADMKGKERKCKRFTGD